MIDSTGRTDVDGVALAWRRVQPAAERVTPPLVFLHGLGSDRTVFDSVAADPALAGPERLLVDLAGHGGSDRPDAWGYAIEAQADLVAGILATLDLPAVTLVGHSMGGSVAIALASRHPDRVVRLIAAEPALDPGTGTLSGHIARQSEAAFVARGFDRLRYQTHRQAERGDPVARHVRETLARVSPVALHRSAVSLRADRSPTFRAQLERLAIPRLLIRGGLTPPPDPPLADPAIERIVIPDAGHTMMLEQPAAFAAAIAAHLRHG